MNKKASLLYVLQILERETDESHALTQEQLLRRLESDYGLSLERKSVANSLSLLKEAGYDVRKKGRGGYALYRHLLDERELPLIYDALFSSEALTHEEARRVFSDILLHQSDAQRKEYPLSLLKTPAKRVLPGKDLFRHLTLLDEAIRKKRKVSLTYLAFDRKGEIVARKKDDHYVVSPYALLSDKGVYYLLGSYEEEGKGLQFFRLDLIGALEVLKKKAQIFKAPEGFNLETYLEAQGNLGGGAPVEASFSLRGEAGILAFKDAFGKRGSLRFEKGRTIGEVRHNEGRLLDFALLNARSVTLLGPEPLKEKLRLRIKALETAYSSSDNPLQTSESDEK